MKKTVFDFEELSVDAGNITVADLKYIQKHGGAISAFQRCIPMTKGKTYKVKATVINTWNGTIYKMALIKMQSDTIVVGDVCYSFTGVYDKFDKFLSVTGSLSKFPELRAFVLDTGGDGGFKVKVTVEEHIAKPSKSKRRRS
ncbi:MAG: hypothetical protein ACHQ0Y_04885 [Thermodesulfovibrionales bacterium]